MTVLDIHVTNPTISPTIFFKAFKKNNYLMIFQTKYRDRKLRASRI